MLTPDELAQAQAEINEGYVTEMRHKLDAMLRQTTVDWAQAVSDNLGTAAYSAVNGRWCDIQKDLERGRVTQAQAVSLLDKLLECRLITGRQYEWYRRKWDLMT